MSGAQAVPVPVIAQGFRQVDLQWGLSSGTGQSLGNSLILFGSCFGSAGVILFFWLIVLITECAGVIGLIFIRLELRKSSSSCNF